MRGRPSSRVSLTLCLGLIVSLLPVHVTSHGGLPHDSSGCEAGWGCFSAEACCPAGISNCNVTVQWRPEGGSIRFRLSAITAGYIALGISISGRMSDSEVYSCNADEVKRGWTNGHSYNPDKIIEGSLTDIHVKSTNGIITCEFLRVQELAGSDDPHFYNIGADNEYTVLAAWANKTDDNGFPSYHDKTKCKTDSKVIFTNGGVHGGGMESEFLPKLHGILMTIAWLGFAAVGITSSRYYKPVWPESTLWGKPVWFAVHRACMVSAFTCFVTAAIVIIIHVQGYLMPSEGPVRFLHAVFGTIAIVLGIGNWLMALFRPHPGTPNRAIFDWAHWGVGTTAFSMALATILLGLADFEGVSPLLGGVPSGVFWVAVCFILFHLAIWMALQYISVAAESTGRDNDVPLVNDDDELEKSPINGNVSTSATDEFDIALHIRRKDLSIFQQSTKKSARMKQLIFFVYVSGVVVAVLVVVIGVIVAKEN